MLLCISGSQALRIFPQPYTSHKLKFYVKLYAWDFFQRVFEVINEMELGCTQVHGGRMKDSLQEFKVSLNLTLKEKLPLCGQWECWNRLSREVVQPPSLRTFKAGLDKTPRNVVLCHSWSRFELEVELADLTRSLLAWIIL